MCVRVRVRVMADIRNMDKYSTLVPNRSHGMLDRCPLAVGYVRRTWPAIGIVTTLVPVLVRRQYGNLPSTFRPANSKPKTTLCIAFVIQHVDTTTRPKPRVLPRLSKLSHPGPSGDYEEIERERERERD